MEREARVKGDAEEAAQDSDDADTGRVVVLVEQVGKDLDGARLQQRAASKRHQRRAKDGRPDQPVYAQKRAHHERCGRERAPARRGPRPRGSVGIRSQREGEGDNAGDGVGDDLAAAEERSHEEVGALGELHRVSFDRRPLHFSFFDTTQNAVVGRRTWQPPFSRLQRSG